MLKLKYLFDNRDLAKMLIEYWQYDKEEKRNNEFFRISSNAIYGYYRDRVQIYLRFSPAEEKTKEYIGAELEYLRYLKEQSYPCVETVLSKDGQEIVEADTPWGRYYAVVFREVSGAAFSWIEFQPERYMQYGKALGRLHRLSKEYKSISSTRKNHNEILNWCFSVFKRNKVPEVIQQQTNLLKRKMADLPLTRDNYGLIHYDFELDNVYWNEQHKEAVPIDFDDMCYHWYVMDIAKTIQSFREELDQEHIQTAQEAFMKGYDSEIESDAYLYEHIELFYLFSYIHKYAVLIEAAEQQWKHEPEWLTELREKLDYAAAQYTEEIIKRKI